VTPEDILEAVRTELRPGDYIIITPLDASLTPNQTREVQGYLQGELPKYRVIVIPFPAFVEVFGEENE
jgi:hypothetical protein